MEWCQTKKCGIKGGALGMVVSIFRSVQMSAPDGLGLSRKRSRREGFQYQMELYFGHKEDKDS